MQQSLILLEEVDKPEREVSVLLDSVLDFLKAYQQPIKSTYNPLRESQSELGSTILEKKSLFTIIRILKKLHSHYYVYFFVRNKTKLSPFGRKIKISVDQLILSENMVWNLRGVYNLFKNYCFNNGHNCRLNESK